MKFPRTKRPKAKAYYKTIGGHRFPSFRWHGISDFWRVYPADVDNRRTVWIAGERQKNKATLVGVERNKRGRIIGYELIYHNGTQGGRYCDEVIIHPDEVKRLRNRTV